MHILIPPNTCCWNRTEDHDLIQYNNSKIRIIKLTKFKLISCYNKFETLFGYLCKSTMNMHHLVGRIFPWCIDYHSNCICIQRMIRSLMQNLKKIKCLFWHFLLLNTSNGLPNFFVIINNLLKDELSAPVITRLSNIGNAFKYS